MAKIQKIAVKNVIAQCQKDMADSRKKLALANECKSLMSTLFTKAEKEWIPEINLTASKAKTKLQKANALLKKALDISVNDENGTMDVAVSSDEGEAVSVTDNTNTGTEGAETNGFPPEKAEDAGHEESAPMGDDSEMQKTFKQMKDLVSKMEKTMKSKK